MLPIDRVRTLKVKNSYEGKVATSSVEHSSLSYPLDFLIYFNDLGRLIVCNTFMTKKFSNYLSKKTKESEIRQIYFRHISIYTRMNTHLIKLLRLTKYERRLYSETVQRSIRD